MITLKELYKCGCMDGCRLWWMSITAVAKSFSAVSNQMLELEISLGPASASGRKSGLRRSLHCWEVPNWRIRAASGVALLEHGIAFKDENRSGQLERNNDLGCGNGDNLKGRLLPANQKPKQNPKGNCQLIDSAQGSVRRSKPSMGCLKQAKREPRRQTNVYALNRLITVLMEAGHSDDAYAVYEQIRPSGCKPNSYTYLHVIKGFCQAGKLAQAQEFFKEVLAGEDLTRGSETLVFNSMVHGLGSAGLVDAALKLVMEMIQRDCSPNVWTYNSIIYSLGNLGKVDAAVIVFESMVGKGCTPDIVTYNSLICSLGKAGRVIEAHKLYEAMIGQGCLPDRVTFNTLLPILGKSGEVTQAINLYKIMKSAGFQPDVYTYTSLVASLCRAGRVDDALGLSVEMTEKGCFPSTATFNCWLDGLCKGDRVVEAHLLFHKMLLLGYVPDRITYSILIDAFCKTGQFVDKSFALLKQLLKSVDILDSKTSEIVYQSFKKVGMLKQAKRIVRNARVRQSRLFAAACKD